MKILKTFLFPKVSSALLMIAVLFIFVGATMAQEQVADISTLKSPKFESQLEELITTVYCYCGCTRETIKACVCQTAQNVETDFRNKLQRGGTVDAIRTDYLEKWGPQFSAVMKAEGVNLIAYIMPAVILISTGGLIMFVLYQSRRDKMPSIQSDNQVSNKLQQQVESELERYKEEN